MNVPTRAAKGVLLLVAVLYDIGKTVAVVRALVWLAQTLF